MDTAAQHLLVSADGWLTCGTARYRCALGKGGVTPRKHEGDGATPAGTFPLRRVFWRADRGERPATKLPSLILPEKAGWCDDPQAPTYNTLVSLPYLHRAEDMWRDDPLYDIVVVIGYNDQPCQPGRGSAIFMHLATGDYTPTEGCVALARPDLEAVLAELVKGSTIEIQA